MDDQRPGPGPSPGPGQQPGQWPPPGQQPGYGQPGQQPGYGPHGQPYGYGQPGQQYGYPPGQYGYGASQPPRKKGGTVTGLLIVVLLLALVGGGGYLGYRALTGATPVPTTPPGAGPVAAPAEPGDDPDDGGALPGADTYQAPACPFNAQQVTAMIGQPMVDSGDCLFGDGRGVAQLAVSASSASSAEAVYETGRQSADNQYLQVDELDTGDKGYIAYKNTSAQAMVITPKGGFTITMSGFEQWDGFQYEQPIRNVISALPR